MTLNELRNDVARLGFENFIEDEALLEQLADLSLVTKEDWVTNNYNQSVSLPNGRALGILQGEPMCRP